MIIFKVLVVAERDADRVRFHTMKLDWLQRYVVSKVDMQNALSSVNVRVSNSGISVQQGFVDVPDSTNNTNQEGGLYTVFSPPRLANEDTSQNQKNEVVRLLSHANPFSVLSGGSTLATQTLTSAPQSTADLQSGGNSEAQTKLEQELSSAHFTVARLNAQLSDLRSELEAEVRKGQRYEFNLQRLQDAINHLQEEKRKHVDDNAGWQQKEKEWMHQLLTNKQRLASLKKRLEELHDIEHAEHVLKQLRDSVSMLENTRNSLQRECDSLGAIVATATGSSPVQEIDVSLHPSKPYEQSEPSANIIQSASNSSNTEFGNDDMLEKGMIKRRGTRRAPPRVIAADLRNPIGDDTNPVEHAGSLSPKSTVSCQVINVNDPCVIN
jgi:hypothetical protein